MGKKMVEKISGPKIKDILFSPMFFLSSILLQKHFLSFD
jgi:hypothetical protein